MTVGGGHDIEGYLVQMSNDVDNDDTNNNKNGDTGYSRMDPAGPPWAPSPKTTEAIEHQPWTVAPGTGMLTYTYNSSRRSANTADVDESLTAGAARWFRVFAITDENDGPQMTPAALQVAVNPAAAEASSAASPGAMITAAVAGPRPSPEDRAGHHVRRGSERRDGRGAGT